MSNNGHSRVACVSRHQWPPLINYSSVQTAIIMAMAQYGGLTIQELCALLNLKRFHINKRLRELQSLKILTNIRWRRHIHRKGGCGKPAPPELMWTIDPRHPLRRRLLLLGRRLAIDFPLLGKPPVRKHRNLSKHRHQLPTIPKLSLSKAQWNILGDEPMARIVMLLSRVSKIQILSLQRLLNLSRGSPNPRYSLVQMGLATITHSAKG